VVDDALTRLLLPSLEREVRRELTEHAQDSAVHIFARNLRSLLLQPPLRGKRVLAIDPGLRTGLQAGRSRRERHADRRDGHLSARARQQAGRGEVEVGAVAAQASTVDPGDRQRNGLPGDRAAGLGADWRIGFRKNVHLARSAARTASAPRPPPPPVAAPEVVTAAQSTAMDFGRRSRSSGECDTRSSRRRSCSGGKRSRTATCRGCRAAGRAAASRGCRAARAACRSYRTTSSSSSSQGAVARRAERHRVCHRERGRGQRLFRQPDCPRGVFPITTRPRAARFPSAVACRIRWPNW